MLRKWVQTVIHHSLPEEKGAEGNNEVRLKRLDPEGSHFFMYMPSANVGLEVGAAVLSNGLFFEFGRSAALGSILGTGRKVAKSA